MSLFQSQRKISELALIGRRQGGRINSALKGKVLVKIRDLSIVYFIKLYLGGNLATRDNNQDVAVIKPSFYFSIFSGWDRLILPDPV